MTAPGPGAHPPLLFLNHSGHHSGAEKVLLDLVDRALDRGHPVTVACPDGPLVEVLGDGVRRLRVPELGGGGDGTPAGRALAASRLLAAWVRAARTLRA